MKKFLLILLVFILLVQVDLKCMDMSWNCGKLRDLCDHQPLIVRSCPKTCGTCCEDYLPKSCPMWKKNGFCQSYFYAGMKLSQYCRKTCGMCGKYLVKKEQQSNEP